MTITQQILHLSVAEFWLFFALAALLSAAALYFSFRYLSRARIIEDTPTARIRSAQQGYVELAGKVQPLQGQAVKAPLSDSVCCWYRYKIEKRGNKNWRTLESDTSKVAFLLRDDTGDCLIEPSGAEVTATEHNTWYGSSRKPVTGTSPSKAAFRLGGFLNLDLSLGGRYRYSEELIRPGDQLYAIGAFSTWGEMERQRERRQMAGDLLRRWKRDQPALLARFDRNRDGVIDSQEWQAANRSAKDQAAYRLQRTDPRHTSHSLGKTDSPRHPFLLSALPQFALVRRFRIWSAGALTVFFLSGGIAAWMLLGRLSG